MRSLGWNKGLGQDSCCKEDLYFNERLFQFKKPTIPSAGLVPVNFDIGSDCTVAYLCNFTGGSGSYEVSYAPGIVNGYPTKAAALASPRWISVINLADNGLTPNSVAWYAVRDKNNVINVIAKSVTIICANIPPTCFHTTTSTTTSTSTTTRAPDPPFFPISDFPLEKRKRFITRVRLNSSTGPIVANSKIITVTNLFSGTQLAQSFTDPLLKSLITTSQNQASQQKTISIIDTLPNLGIVDIPCADDRVYIYVIGSTTGTVYGGGTVNGVLTAYSEDSDIATAAVHAGIIRPGQIAYVKRQYVYYYRDATKISFFGENKNDITSLTRFEGCGFYFDPAGTIFPAAGPSTTSTTTNAPGLLPGLCRGVYGVNNILLKSSIDLGPILSNEPSKVLGNFDYPQEMYQIMWTGYFVPPIDDTFTFSCDFVDDTFYMWIGFHAERGNPYPLEKANLVVNINTVSTFSIDLKRGEPYPIRLLYLQALTVRNFNFQVSGINFLKTNDLDYMIYHDLCAPAFVSASVVPSSTSVDENLNPLTFTINTSGFPVGSNIYWYFDSVEAIDWTLNTNLGSYQSSTLTGFEANTSITAKAWAELVNLVYLRHLGRFPENVGTVDGNVSRLLAGQLTLDQLDTEVYASVEAASYRVAPPNKRRFGNITTTGTTMSVPITGTVVYDSRYEGPQTGNLLVRFESLSGVIIANSSVTINDTVPIHKDFDPIPTILYPGVRHQMSFFTLGSNYFANEPMKIKVLPAVGSGNVSIPASAFTISPATWTMPNANTHIHTFTIQINTPYTFTASEEYFRLGAHVGIAETLCAGTNNIKVMDNVVVTYPCPAAVTYQGGIQFPAQHRVDLGTNTTGTVKLTYTAYSVPDRFMVIHDGAIVADSGYVGSPSMLGDVNSAFGGWPSSHTIDGVTINHTPISSVGPNNQAVGLSFTKKPAVRYATVLIFAPIQGTAWECTLACPIPPPSSTTTTSTLPAGSPGLFRSTFSNVGPTTSLLIEKSIDAVPTLEGVRTATDPNGFVYDVPQGRYTQHWVGNLFAATTETYTFYCDGVDDGFFLWIGDHTLNPSFDIYDSASANLVVTLGGANSYSIPLTAGIKYPIRMTYIQVTGPASFNFQYSTPTKAKTSDISGLFFSDSSPGTLSTFEVVPSQYAIDEGQPLSFDVNTTNVPIGTRLYWWFNSVEAIDFTTNPGTYVSTTLSGSNPTSNIQASHYEGWINLIYLRQLGRHPENSSVVDGYVADLLTNATTLNDVDSQVYNLPEAASYRAGGASYRRSGDFLTTGSTYTVNGTVIYDNRFEGPQTANILIRTEGHDGPIVANANVLFKDTSQIRGDFNPGPINLVPGYTHTMSFTVLSSAWAGTPFKMEVMPPDGTGAAISANDITVGNQFFTAPSANSYTHTFTITVNAGYTSANPEEWFKLGAKVGATYDGLFVGTANIRVFP